jgi:ABC-2 type transport system permease protein
MDFDLSPTPPEKVETPPAPLPVSAPPSTSQIAPLASPIADLSYRHYDGPLKAHAFRWWIVSLANIRQVFRRPAFWGMCVACLLPYLIHALSIYIEFRFAQMGLQAGPPGGRRGRGGEGPPMLQFAPGERFAHHFFTALTGDVNSLLLLLIALMVGSGSIAADTRANALMVYLSKPITKGDYLLGKWVGIFLPIYFAACVPGLLLYLFCLMSYTSDGFLRDEPWLVVRLLAAAAVPASIHASLLVGCSAWSKTPRLAGATYAGIYFITAIISGSILGPIFFRANPSTRALLQHVSISGTVDGLVQNIYNTRAVSGLLDIIANQGKPQLVERPALWLMASLAAALIIVGITLARMRIRAVEVVRG